MTFAGLVRLLEAHDFKLLKPKGSVQGFYAPDLPGFTGVGTSIQDCVEKARVGMDEHVALLREQGMPVPAPTADPSITIHNQRGLADAAGF